MDLIVKYWSYVILCLVVITFSGFRAEYLLAQVCVGHCHSIVSNLQDLSYTVPPTLRDKWKVITRYLPGVPVMD